MIYLVHVDPNRKDLIKQSELLVKSHNDVGNTERIVVIKQNQSKKFKKYNLPDNYALYNRYISIIEYISDNNLENEIICVLDCDMFFLKKLIPKQIDRNEIVSQKWEYGKIVKEWRKAHWELFDLPEFSPHKSRIKNFDIYNPELILVPYYGYGSTIKELFTFALNAEKHFRKYNKDWETEMYCVSFAATCLNVKITYDKLGAMANFVGESYKDYYMIHYGFPVLGKDDNAKLKKYNIWNREVFLEEIKEFEKIGPKSGIHECIFEFYKKVYEK